MTRTVINARLHTFALLLVWAAWMFTTGLLAQRIITETNGPIPIDSWLAAAFSLLVAVVAWAGINSRLPELAHRARLWAVRVVGLAAVIGVASFAFGLSRHDPDALGGWLPASNEAANLLGVRVALGIVGFFLLVLAPSGDYSPAPFFLTNRNHASDAIARRSLAAAAGQALLVALTCGLALRFRDE